MAWIRHDDRQTEDADILRLVSTPKIGHRAYYERHRIMEWAARHERGTHPRDLGVVPLYVLKSLGVPKNVVALLIDLDLLQPTDDASVKIRNWEKYQSPQTGAERQASLRRRRNETEK